MPLSLKITWTWIWEQDRIKRKLVMWRCQPGPKRILKFTWKLTDKLLSLIMFPSTCINGLIWFSDTNREDRKLSSHTICSIPLPMKVWSILKASRIPLKRWESNVKLTSLDNAPSKSSKFLILPEIPISQFSKMPSKSRKRKRKIKKKKSIEAPQSRSTLSRLLKLQVYFPWVACQKQRLSWVWEKNHSSRWSKSQKLTKGTHILN